MCNVVLEKQKKLKKYLKNKSIYVKSKFKKIHVVKLTELTPSTGLSSTHEKIATRIGPGLLYRL